jgi:hypothetical protein
MRTLMTCLLTAVNQYRDKRIAHSNNPRSLYTTFITHDDRTQIGIGFTPPKEGEEQIVSPVVGDVYRMLDEYVSCLLDLISNNRSRSRYAPKTE